MTNNHGWWLSHPSEKYSSNWKSSPIFGMKFKKSLKPPPSNGWNMTFLLGTSKFLGENSLLNFKVRMKHPGRGNSHPTYLDLPVGCLQKVKIFSQMVVKNGDSLLYKVTNHLQQIQLYQVIQCDLFMSPNVGGHLTLEMVT